MKAAIDRSGFNELDDVSSEEERTSNCVNSSAPHRHVITDEFFRSQHVISDTVELMVVQGIVGILLNVK